MNLPTSLMPDEFGTLSMLRDASGEYVASALGNRGDLAGRADFIRRAVNNHDALVEALKGILSNPGGRCTAEQWDAGLKALRKALDRP